MMLQQQAVDALKSCKNGPNRSSQEVPSTIDHHPPDRRYAIIIAGFQPRLLFPGGHSCTGFHFSIRPLLNNSASILVFGHGLTIRPQMTPIVFGHKHSATKTRKG
nr:hypothetical protein Itr_chr14CG27090 [Ipomoea trifida]